MRAGRKVVGGRTVIYGSLCSGIEAASMAWHPLGWKPAFFSEIDKSASRVLAHHYPDVPNHGDMTKFQEWPDHAIDLLVGGTPCQSFSVAGLRKGMADPRGNLALTYLAVADRYRPRWLLWENVPGVLSSNGGRDFGAFLGGLGELGYGWAYRVLDAQYVRVDGFGRAVPQRRRRVFVVGCLGDWRRAAAVLFERESLCWHSPPRREAGKGVAPTIASRPTGGGGLGTEFDCDGGLICNDIAPTLNAHFGTKQGLEDQHIRGGQGYSLPTVSKCLNAGGMGRIDAESETLIATTGGGFDVAHSLKAEGFDASEDGTGRGTPIVPVAGTLKSNSGGGGFGSDPSETFVPVAYRTTGNDGCYETGDVIGALNTATDPNQHVVAFDMRGREGGAQFEGPHDTANIRAASGGSSRSYVAQTWAVRRLTPTECEALQGFPRNYTFLEGSAKPQADGPRYKQLGNSMAVNCMRWIGRRIEMVEAAMKAESEAA